MSIRRRRSVLALAAVLGVVGVGCGGTAERPAGSAAAPIAEETLAQVPLHFEPVDGDGGRFLSRAGSYSLLVEPGAATVVLDAAPSATVRLGFGGPAANPSPAVEALDRQPGTTSYLVGADPAGWRTTVPHFARVRTVGVYPGIDAVFYGNQGHVEYDLVVAPGADPSAVVLTVDGSAPPRLDGHGNLVLDTAAGPLVQHAPRLYQDVDGVRRAVHGEYVIHREGTVGFRVGAYDASSTLVIDPVLAYSTYLGGSGADWSKGIAVDGAGNVYLAGGTDSPTFPGATAVFGLPGDAFVTKLGPSGSLLWTTVLGGFAYDTTSSIAVDGAGNAYVTGETWSADFPAVNALQGLKGHNDAFVTKLNPSGGIVYSTFLGGSGSESSEGGIAVDGSGQAVVTGYTTSTDFPTKNALQGTLSGGSDVYVTKLDASGSSFVYSTYLGGPDSDYGYDVAVTAGGTAFVTGGTWSPNFPVKNAAQPTWDGQFDAFVSSFDASGGLLYSTFLGGDLYDFGFGVATDGVGAAYVTGLTTSADFPVRNPFQAGIAGSSDVFVAKLDAAGGLVYSTYVGGSGGDMGQEIAVDAGGAAYVSGATTSNNFPLVDPVRAVKTSDAAAFLFKLAPSGSSLAYSTYLGPSLIPDEHTTTGVALDSAANAHVMGTTPSSNFPTVNAFQPGFGGGPYDVFVVKVTAGGSGGTTTVSPGFGEPGGQVTAAATGAEPNSLYVLAMSTSAAGCASGQRLGGAVISSPSGVIAPTVRTIPTNATSGTRYLCWVNAEDSSASTAPVAVTVF